MNTKMIELWQLLQNAGVVQGEAPSVETPDSPWFVKVLLGFSGWLAALFVLGFIGAAFAYVFRTSTTAFILGAILIGVAYAIFRIPRNEFFSQLALAVSMAGQLLVVFGIFNVFQRYDEMSWAMTALLQVPLAIFMPNFIHRVLSSLFAAFAFHTFLIMVGAPYVFSSILLFVIAWLWLNEFRFPRHINKMRAIGYGLVIALIPLKGSVLFNRGIWWGGYSSTGKPEMLVQPWMGELLAAIVTLYVVWQLLLRYEQPLTRLSSILILLGTVLFSAISMEAHGVTIGVVIILLGFFASNRVLLGLGIVSLLFYISTYYYLLNETLLYKAMVLLIFGGLFLLMRWVLQRFVISGREVSDAG